MSSVESRPQAGHRSHTLAAFRQRHAGETILVCGCGPSLNDLRDPQRFVTIGVNDVGRLFDPSYLVVVNPRQQFKGDRFRYVEQSRAGALFTQLDLGPVAPPVVRFRLGELGGTEIGGAEVLHYTQNSPYVAVCLAAWMGAARIGLVGVDFTDHHFFAQTGRHALSGRLREIDAQYGQLCAALRRRGVALLNLGAGSRLNSLPRARLEDDGQWTTVAPTPAPSSAITASGPVAPGRARMQVAIEKRSAGAVGDLLDALARTIAGLGHAVSRNPAHAAQQSRTLSIVWNGRWLHGRGPVLFCEHGWLPRSDYQISPRGINAGSHEAPWAWDGQPLDEARKRELDAHFERIKAATHGGHYRYMQVAGEIPTTLPPEFLLVALQIENDTNIIRHAPATLRTMQALVDHVARLDPPWPVIFKQHPADARGANAHLRLRPRRPQDAVWAHARGNVHQMLKSAGCRGILTINSNVAHDGLLWDVPAIALGRNIWPSTGAGRKPFLTAVPRDWSALAESAASREAIDCRRAYAHFLMRTQWTLSDAQDPRRVQALIDSAVRSHVRTVAPQVPARAVVRLVPPRPAPAPARPRKPLINVVAGDRGWLFESWKQALARHGLAGFDVQATAKPQPHAAAWLYLRTAEAATAPDPQRTVVQLHDLADEGAYAADGARAGALRCAAFSLTHPAQQALLESHGIALAQRRWLLQPPGWQGTATDDAAATDALPTVAWVGRPARSGDREVSGLPLFIEAARRWAGRVRVVLVGERLESCATALRRAGVDCRLLGLAECPPQHAARWLSRFDLVVVTSTADSGPWPLFDALQAGVPVVALPVGWAPALLGDGAAGRVVDDADGLAATVPALLADHAQRATRRAAARAKVAGYGFDAWLDVNLQLAAELAQPQVRRAV